VGKLKLATRKHAAASARGDRLKFLVSSVPTDSHTWNLVVLQLLIEEMGHQVVNLGACVPVHLLLSACRAERPDYVVLSTVNGHGQADGARVIHALRADPALAGLVVVIGGRFGTRGDAGPGLRARGYDAVFPADVDGPARAVEQLREFVESRAAGAR
jgi:methylaspartate mutase sigma subunit